MSSPMTSLELRSTITSDGLLRVTLENVPVQEPGPGQLLVRIEAAPINPSDLGLLFGPADMTPLQAGGDGRCSCPRSPYSRTTPFLRLPITYFSSFSQARAQAKHIQTRIHPTLGSCV